MLTESVNCEWSTDRVQERGVLITQRLERASKIFDGPAQALSRLAVATGRSRDAGDHRQVRSTTAQGGQHAGKPTTAPEYNHRVAGFYLFRHGFTPNAPSEPRVSAIIHD